MLGGGESRFARKAVAKKIAVRTTGNAVHKEISVAIIKAVGEFNR